MAEFPIETREIKLGTMVKFIANKRPQSEGIGISSFDIQLEHKDEKKKVKLNLSVTAEDGW